MYSGECKSRNAFDGPYTGSIGLDSGDGNSSATTLKEENQVNAANDELFEVRLAA